MSNSNTTTKRTQFNYDALAWKIDAVFGTEEAFCREANTRASELKSYLRGGRKMPTDLIIRACDLLSIPQNEIGFYFFNAREV